MSALNAYLEQISECTASISKLHFPPSKIFTNALLRSQDITALIRDIETHERGLFFVAQPTRQQISETSRSDKRATTFHVNEASNAYNAGFQGLRGLRKNTAVRAILGKDLAQKIHRGGGDYTTSENKEKGEIDVEVLLTGAEKLCSVHPVPGLLEEITKLRQRHQKLIDSIAKYECRVAEQARLLSQLNKTRDIGFIGEEKNGDGDKSTEHFTSTSRPMQEVRLDEGEIEELEKKKHMMESRVAEIEKDLAGVLR